MGSCPLRILIADDAEEWRYILTRLLETDHDVIGYAQRGDQVLAIASSLRPDVITLDISMPGQSGLEVLPALREALPDAIIVIVSTTALPIYREEAFKRGADGYVPKKSVSSELTLAISAARSRANVARRQQA